MGNTSNIQQQINGFVSEMGGEGDYELVEAEIALVGLSSELFHCGAGVEVEGVDFVALGFLMRREVKAWSVP